MKAKELRSLSIDELQAKLEELKKELFKLRFERSVSESADKMRKRKLKRDIARVLTVINEKKGK